MPYFRKLDSKQLLLIKNNPGVNLRDLGLVPNFSSEDVVNTAVVGVQTKLNEDY